ncbi:outer membrane protein assembly factor BamB [Noviherbaspirillum sp. UKPF54]|uniref:outer membrane protein assembly factor BamB n=1 Tax=Noviherbaspirillum sp. UKPF54 TaxID=2601898 RepID=UPI0011B1887A|nr:outer membrane protein assembly factor BamB [Noviherbaspirillum sp. UKPF54]QDZ28172.1 outer membrane protein assembly factor BamB [Noviherbaspirillum sp. UKPF54]
MRIAVKLGCIAVAVALAGCSSLNPFSHKETRNPPAPLVDFKPTLTVRTVWSASVGKSDGFVFSPALANGSIYAAAAKGGLERIDAATGRSIWRIDAGTRLTAGVGTDGTIVAVAGEKGMLLAFDADGKLRWKAQASSEVLSAPAVGQGLVIVRSVDNRIAAYDVESGTRRWIVQRTAPPLTLRTAPGIVISGATAYVAMPGGRLLALTLANGGPRWEVAVGDPRGTTELERVADVSGAPVLAGRDVCAVAYQGRIGCFDAMTGAVRWGRELSSDVGLGIDDRFVYAADDKGNVTAFSRESGSGAWRNSKLVNRDLSTPVAFDGKVAVGDAQGYIHFLSREDGAFVARTNPDGSAITAATPLVDGKNVIFQTQAGTVVALAAN